MPRTVWPKALLPCSQWPSTDPILSHMNPVHDILSSFHKIYFNIILSSKQEYSKCSPFLLFLKILFELLFFPILSTRPANLMLLFSIRTTEHSQKKSNFLSWPTDIPFLCGLIFIPEKIISQVPILHLS